jgi:hypothetical protein
VHNLFIHYDYNNPVLTWQPLAGSKKYYVYRGGKKIHETNLTQYKDIDNNVMTRFDREKKFYYISSIDENNTETIFTDKIQFQIDQSSPFKNVYREIIRRHNMMLDISGETVDFYIKKQSGERCSECFNEITRDVDTEKELCSECYNTSFQGGFEKIQGKIRILNAEDSIEEVPFGIQIVSSKRGFLVLYPFLNTGDWFRSLTGDIYIVDSVKHKRGPQGLLTRQELSIKLLQSTHPYYSIKL